MIAETYKLALLSTYTFLNFIVLILLNFTAFQESRPSLDTLDIEKALDLFCSSVNIKDCQVDPGLLQNLQPLLQFAADLALFILFMLAQNSKVSTDFVVEK